MMCGSASEKKPMDEETKAMVLGVKGPIEEELGKKFEKFEPKSYTTQVVAGVNYTIDIDVDGGTVNLKLFKALDGEVQCKEATFAAA
mmetsp:Transcript_108191/g.170569  ORF Transcript_108191/g.170569 Transcript_108191/m.170569 type:complete len:87 (-) Transcript_108191:60-320(-)|eukprot:CAMPEP_0169078270 /NCGR_PEP_ID=MMETSP1015-20121227/9323_1 /TAXON_ID=342587 /ORGANISM="Karlodinium micrum, Strain CCMP2283" /LENGTH=86 /DNA_ID=CAMNT_0009137851 /DNA_START=75 /DNA_END=335 /DNA_ORIENTATION=-